MSKKDLLTSMGVKYFLPISLIFFLFGCSLWRDFTTYFNTYYNAKTLYDDVEKEILDLPSNLFNFKENKLPPKLNESLEKVIEKCSKIMQYETESSFFDNALFMTGKAFYYQQSYSKALRKFMELSALEETDLLLDSRLWEGKTQFQLREYDTAYKLLDEVKAEALKEDRQEIYKEAYITQISYLINEEEYLTAINQAENFVKSIDSDELKAEIYYELGKLYMKLDNLEDAARVFLLVSEYSPAFNIEFSSKLELARIKKNEGKTEESLDLFYEMKNENKFSDSLGVVELEIADIYYLNGDLTRAYNHLTYIDTTFVRNISGGIAKYRRAQIYELDYMQYDTAMALYGNVMNSMAPKELKEKAQAKYRLLDKYKLYHNNIAENLRLLSYIENPALYVKDSLAYEEYLAERFVRADSIANSKQLAQQMLSDPNNTSTATSEMSIAESRNQNARTDKGDWLNVKNPNAKDEVIMYPPPKPKISADSVNKLISKEYYDLGNLFFTDLNVPDSAYEYYEKILTEYPDSHQYVKALYAKGTYFAFVQEKAKADSIFQIVYDQYPKSSVYEEAAKQLGKIKSASESDSAYPIYLDAEQKYYNSQLDSAISGFMQIYTHHSESTLAPKALYTIGFILENDLHNYDSAAVIYKTLNDNYTDSYYARSILRKLNLYTEAHKPPQDSVAVSSDLKKEQKPELVENEASIKETDSNKVIEKKAPAPVETAKDKMDRLKLDKTKKKAVVSDSVATEGVKNISPSLQKETPVQRDSTFIDE